MHLCLNLCSFSHIQYIGKKKHLQCFAHNFSHLDVQMLSSSTKCDIMFKMLKISGTQFLAKILQNKFVLEILANKFQILVFTSNAVQSFVCKLVCKLCYYIIELLKHENWKESIQYKFIFVKFAQMIQGGVFELDEILHFQYRWSTAKQALMNNFCNVM